jgi:hypothetical protein
MTSKAIAYFLGFGYIAISSALILYTRQTTDFFKDIIQSYQLKYLSILPILIGILFLAAAPAIAYPWLFIIFALIAFVEAALAIADPRKLYSRFLDWYFGSVSDQTERLFGIIGIIFGTAILTWIK